MLSTLVDNNELNSWNIFSTRHGVCLNIRFSNAEPGSHSPVYYRKQTPRQAKRNLDRAYTHRHGIAAAHSEANPTIPKEAVDYQNNAKTTPVPKKQDINMSTSKKRKINKCKKLPTLWEGSLVKYFCFRNAKRKCYHSAKKSQGVCIFLFYSFPK